MPDSPELPQPACPLCSAAGPVVWHRDSRRHYWRCQVCELVFVAAAEHLPAVAEKAEYDLHQNSLTDAGYRRFLGRLAAPVLAHAAASGRALSGIDFGCGPVPLLASMLAQGGIAMQVWDPIFQPGQAVLAQRYDVVTASEVVEHFRDPAAAFAQLFGLLKADGLLAVMTKRSRDHDAFARWHYILDPTHIAFYNETTFAWLATRYGAALTVIGDDVVVFRAAADENAAMIAASLA